MTHELVIQPDHRRPLHAPTDGGQWPILMTMGRGRVRAGATTYRAAVAALMEPYDRYRYIGLPNDPADSAERHVMRCHLARKLCHFMSLTGRRLATEAAPGSHPVDALIDPSTDGLLVHSLADAGIGLSLRLADPSLMTTEALWAE